MFQPNKELYEFDVFRLDISERILFRQGHRVPLADKAFETLCALVKHGNHLVAKDELLAEVWADAIVEENNLDKNISYLRKVLGEKKDEAKFIETVRGHGYRFLPEVRNIEAELKNDGADAASFTEQSKVETNFPIVAKQYETQRSGNVVALAKWRHEEAENPTESEADEKAEDQSVGNSPTPATTEQLAQDQSAAPSGYHHLQLDARHNKQRYFPAVGAFLVLFIAGFGLVWYIQSRRAATVPNMREQAVTFKRLTYDSKSNSPAISADGKHLAYTVSDKDQVSIWLKNLANNSTVQVMPPATNDYSALAFSPDGNQLYYFPSTGFLCHVPVFGGTPQCSVKDVWSQFALSPDGKRVVFTRQYMPAGDIHLIIANVDGSGERDILKGNADFGLPLWGSKQAWSPDGQKIAVGGWRKDESGVHQAVLFEVNISDGTVREIPSPHWDEIREVAWLSDNSGFIVTAAEKEGAPYQIWQLAAASGEAGRLTNDANHYDAISLTADSRTLVAHQLIDFTHIWIAPDGDANRTRQLTSGTNRDDGTQGLYWMSDGKLVFVSPSDDEIDLWMMDADGANRKQLTTKTDGGNLSPRVTPDGRYIVFTSTRTGQKHIWRMDADGNNQLQLSDGEDGTSPTISPDGLWVYYTAFGTEPPTSLRKVSIDGGASVRLPAKYYFDRPAVSPDGKLLVYQYRADRTGGIAVMSLESGESLKLFENLPAERGIARFTPDSQAILYITNGNTFGNLWRQPLDGSPPQQFTYFTEGYISNFALSADGHQLALAHGQHFNDVVLIENFK